MRARNNVSFPRFLKTGKMLLAAGALCSSTLHAAEAAAPVFAFGELLKLVFALAVTIALFVAMAYVMKRMQLGTGRANNLITVLSALSLGGKEKIYLLDIAGEQIVVGSSPGSVSRIHVLEKRVENRAGPEALPAAMNTFTDVLRTFRKGTLE